jgi:hypothetical protein
VDQVVGDRKRRATLVRALAVLGVLLVVLAATAEATHTHAADTRHDCALCAVSHAAIEGVYVYQYVPVLGVSTALPASEQNSFSSLTDTWHIIRPPPAA